MALRWPARVKAQTSTTGTGTLSIAEPGAAGWRTLTRAVTDNDLASGDEVCFITVDTTVTNGPNLLEIAKGVWDNTAKTLTRATVYQPNGTAVNWGAGTRDVIVIDNPVLFAILGALNVFTEVQTIRRAGTGISPSAATCLVLERSSAGLNCLMSVISSTTGKAQLSMGDPTNQSLFDLSHYASSHATQPNWTEISIGGSVRLRWNNSTTAWETAAGLKYVAWAGSAATAVPFYQASAPSGWTKITTNTDKALRVVSGTGGGSGGSRVLSSATVGGTSLSISQLPAHYHTVSYQNFVVSGGEGNNVAQLPGAGSQDTSTVGSDATHDHALALAYVDVIICSLN